MSPTDVLRGVETDLGWRRWSRRRVQPVRWQRLVVPATAVHVGTWIPSRRHRRCLTRVVTVARTSDSARARIVGGDGTEIVADVGSEVVVARLLAVGDR